MCPGMWMMWSLKKHTLPHPECLRVGCESERDGDGEREGIK